MNKIHRVVWNEITATWVAVAEIAKGHGKRSGTVGLSAAPDTLFLPPLKALVASLALIGTILPSATFAQVAATQLPNGGNVVAGTASITQSAAVMTINQTTNRAAIDWNTFNVGSAAQVNFNQPSSSSVTLNRVLDSNPSQIFGRITAPGQVFLTNPNGVFFAPGSSVDVGGLVATTHRIGVDDFMAGSTTFDRNGATGSVVNEGELKAALGGYIALLAPEVHNEGVIIAQAGTVALASGEAISLNFGENGTLAGITTTQSQIAALVENKNAVLAPGGLIILSAQAVSSLQGGVINNSGSLAASSLTEKGGRIWLEGDRVLQQGSITASGGDISIKANDAYFGQGVTSVANPEGVGGNISVITSTNLDAVAGHLFDASGTSGGNILVDGGEAGSILASATFAADGNQGVGGSVKLTAHQVSLLSAQVSANGVLDGGTINIGGEWQGGGDLRHADVTLLNAGSRISASSSEGAGGTVSLWSTQLTGFDGQITATGASRGGRIEVSSSGDLSMNGTITAGQGGEVLFDPKNITIANIPGTVGTWKRKILQSTFGITTEGTGVDTRNFGQALALDGDLMAIGYYSQNSNKGSVYLFNGANSENYGSLALRAALTDSTGAVGMTTLTASDGFGKGVSINQGRLAVSAWGDNTYKGAVYLFDGVGTDFSGLTYRSKISSGSGATSMPTLANYDSFGTSLSMDGDRLAVGALGDDTGGFNYGAVHLFSGLNAAADFSGVTWQGKLASGTTAVASGMPTLTSTSHFGRGVSLDGGLLAVGAPESTNYGVYLFSGLDTADNSTFSGLTYRGKLTSGATTVATGIPTFASDDSFGYSVALDNGKLVVGASGDDTGNSGAGALYIFSGTGSDFSGLTYDFRIRSGQGATGMPALGINEALGLAVALDGTHLIGGGQGSVHLFDLVVNPTTTDSVASATYSNNPGANSTITPDTITTLLNAGTAVTLQANNDITVSSAVTANNPGGAGGAFTLLAGRSIAINAAITTDDGAFTAVAGDASADSAYKDVGTSALTVGAAINTGAGAVSLTSAGTISGSGSITTTNQNLTLSTGSGSGTLSGILGLGSGSLTKAGAGTIILSGNNTYTGTTNIDAGTLRASHANALGTTAGNTVVASGATLAVTSGINLAKTLQLSGTGVSNAGALNLLGTNTYSGNITLAADASIVGATGTQTLSGTINGAQSLSMTSIGNWVLNGNIGATTSLTSLIISSTGTVIDTGTGSIVAGSLALLGTGGSYTLDSTSNNVTTLAANTGSVSFYESDGLTIGTVGSTNGITATNGTVLVESGVGDIGIAQNISASSTGTSAIIINAGKATAAGTATGGNIVLSGSPTVTTGAGGRAALMTGSVTGSSGLAALAGAGNYRYNSDETAPNYTNALGSGTYAIYREQPTVTVTAAAATKTFDGLAYTGGNGVTYSGFVNSETSSVLSGTMAYSGTSQGATNVGSYVITPSGLSNGLGYALAYADGTLTINAASAPTPEPTDTSPVIVPPDFNIGQLAGAGGNSVASADGVGAAQIGVNGISISIDRESTSGLGQSETQNVMLTVSLPGDMATAGSGFSFELPSSVQALIENDLPMISLSDGSPLPDWIRFNSATMRFEAQAVPDGAFPLQVLITTSRATVLIVISERKE